MAGGERAVREPPLREKKEVARWRDSSTPLRYARNDMFPDGDREGWEWDVVVSWGRVLLYWVEQLG